MGNEAQGRSWARLTTGRSSSTEAGLPVPLHWRAQGKLYNHSVCPYNQGPLLLDSGVLCSRVVREAQLISLNLSDFVVA